MQIEPDHQTNYWQRDLDEADSNGVENPSEPEMYTPEPDNDSNPPLNSEPGESEKTVADDEPVHWSASEYIHEEKNSLWFVMFAIVALTLIAVDIFLMKSYTFSVLVLVMAAAIIIFSRRPPRVIEYTLSGDQGLYVGEKLYHFSEFKAFGLIDDREHHSIMLIPVKRFAPSVSVYFPEEVGEEIVDIFGARLPMEALKLDAIDIIVRKLRL